MSFSFSNLCKLLYLIFCKQLGINYDKLSKEKFVSLINILKKSSLLKVQPNKRGKNKPKRK